MKTGKIKILIPLLTLLLGAAGLGSEAPKKTLEKKSGTFSDDNQNKEADTFIIRFRPGTSKTTMTALLSALHCKIESNVGPEELLQFLVRIEKGSYETIAAKLQNEKSVLLVQPNYKYKAF